jgi:hypothetical protein
MAHTFSISAFVSSLVQELGASVPELLEAIGYWFPIYVKASVRGECMFVAACVARTIS